MRLTTTSAWSERPVSRLSDGERQRVFIAKALAQETPLILLDEPTAFLDYPSRVQFFNLLKRLTNEMGSPPTTWNLPPHTPTASSCSPKKASASHQLKPKRETTPSETSSNSMRKHCTVSDAPDYISLIIYYATPYDGLSKT